MSDSVGDATVVRCTCGAKLKVKPGSEGKKFKCPKCQAVVQVPVAETYDLSPEPQPEPDLLAGMKSLASSSKAAASVPAAKPTRTIECPRCNSKMAEAAILCTACGYNTQTGRIEKGAKAGGGAVRKIAAGASPFVLGCVYTGVAALIGAAVWFFIVYKTGYQIGWIAWGIGGFTGFAMMKGYGQQSTVAAVIAAAMAAGSILLAKVAMFVFIIYAVATGDTSNPELKKAFIIVSMANEMLDDRSVFDPAERAAQWEATVAEAERNVRGMAPAQIDQLWHKYQEDLERENAFADESGRKRARIAQHRADLRVIGEGLPRYSLQRSNYYKEEFSKVRSLDETSLAAEMARIEAWEKGGKQQDEKYIRDNLIYLIIDDEISAEASEADSDDFEYPEGEEWKALHAEVAGEVDAMSHEERLTKAKSLEETPGDYELRDAVIDHRTDLQARREGLRLYGEQWDELYEETSSSCKSLSHEELTAEVAKIEAWENGDKWKDEAYVRDELIYAHADLAAWQEEQKLDPGSEERFSFPSDGQWREFHAAAIPKADAVPPEQRRAAIEQLQAQEAEERSRFWEQQSEPEDSEETDEALAGLGAAFVSFMFSPLDVLFFLLAVGTAFRVARGSDEA